MSVARTLSATVIGIALSSGNRSVGAAPLPSICPAYHDAVHVGDNTGVVLVTTHEMSDIQVGARLVEGTTTVGFLYVDSFANLLVRLIPRADRKTRTFMKLRGDGTEPPMLMREHPLPPWLRIASCYGS